MRVLIDQNISYRIIQHIAFLFDETAHIKTKNWIDWNDYDIFKEARQQQFDAIITLDEDFNKLLLEHGTPPKIIWLKVGNCSTDKLASIIIAHQVAILDFVSNPIFDCLEIYS